MMDGAFEPNPWRRFLEEVVSGGHREQRPSGLERTCGAAFIEALTNLDLLIPVGRARTIPSPDFEQPGEWEVTANPNEDDLDHPWLARPIDDPERIGLFLNEDEVRTVKFSMRRFAEHLRTIFRIQGKADWARPVFPNAHRLGQVEWRGIEREVLLCTDLRGPAPALHLQLHQTRCLPTLVLAPIQMRWMRPEVLNLIGAGLVTLTFLDELLTMERGRIVRTPRTEALQAPPSLCDRSPEYCPFIQLNRVEKIYCRCLDAEGERALTQAEYQQLLSERPNCDLALDLTQMLQAGRHPTWRREDGASVEGSVTPQQGAANAELMEAQKPLRPSQLKALHGALHPERQIEAARRALDWRLGRYEWRATRLIKGESPEAAQYWFRPPRASGGACSNHSERPAASARLQARPAPRSAGFVVASGACQRVPNGRFSLCARAARSFAVPSRYRDCPASPTDDPPGQFMETVDKIESTQPIPETQAAPAKRPAGIPKAAHAIRRARRLRIASNAFDGVETSPKQCTPLGLGARISKQSMPGRFGDFDPRLVAAPLDLAGNSSANPAQ